MTPGGHPASAAARFEAQLAPNGTSGGEARVLDTSTGEVVATMNFAAAIIEAAALNQDHQRDLARERGTAMRAGDLLVSRFGEGYAPAFVLSNKGGGVRIDDNHRIDAYTPEADGLGYPLPAAPVSNRDGGVRMSTQREGGTVVNVHRRFNVAPGLLTEDDQHGTTGARPSAHARPRNDAGPQAPQQHHASTGGSTKTALSGVIARLARAGGRA